MMLVFANERCRTIARSARSSRLGRLDWRTILAFALPFILYILTLAPTVYNLDSAELTTAAATAGITRATGYPLYLLLGYRCSWLPRAPSGRRSWSITSGGYCMLAGFRRCRSFWTARWTWM